jgi:hypothetical protein
MDNESRNNLSKILESYDVDRLVGKHEPTYLKGQEYQKLRDSLINWRNSFAEQKGQNVQGNSIDKQ